MRTERARARGFRAERELARKLWDRGLAVIRGPASGSGARHVFYPDMVVMYNRKIAVLEVKARSKLETIRIDGGRASRLAEFARRAGAYLFVAVHVPGMGWRFVEVKPDDASLEGVRIAADTIAKGYTLDQFVSLMKAESIVKYVKGSSDG